MWSRLPHHSSGNGSSPGNPSHVTIGNTNAVPGYLATFARFILYLKFPSIKLNKKRAIFNQSKGISPIGFSSDVAPVIDSKVNPNRVHNQTSDKSNTDDDKELECIEECEEVTWEKVSQAIDKFCFFLFGISFILSLFIVHMVAAFDGENK